MSQGARIPLAKAQRTAERVLAELSSYCSRMEIVGSVRRRRPDVGDVDILCQLHDGPLHRRGLEQRVRRNPDTKILVSGAEKISCLLPNGVQLEIYFARAEQNDLAGYVPTNWGMRMLTLTGSKEHNIFLAQQAAKRGFHFAPTRGLMRGGNYVLTQDGREYKHGTVFCSADECKILTELGLGWIPPEQREREVPHA